MTHLSGKELQEVLEHAKTLISIGSTYVHYKNSDHRYTVIDLGILEADEAIAVIYQAQYGEKLTFIRPLASWLDIVTLGDKQIPRFSLITDTEYR